MELVLPGEAVEVNLHGLSSFQLSRRMPNEVQFASTNSPLEKELQDLAF